jgi:hypothetical protein
MALAGLALADFARGFGLLDCVVAELDLADLTLADAVLAGI